LRIRVNKAFQKGIDCILKTQIKEDGVLNVWCQQHDNVDLIPQKARSYELAVICNGESAGIVKFLMSINEPDEKIINSIQSAVKWFEESKIYGVKPRWIKAPKAEYQYHSTEYDVVTVRDSEAPPVWTRFYELGTHKPMFCRRDGKVVYKLEEVERERRTGYS
jgi:PelA/Pel-15E family pectate lyase